MITWDQIKHFEPREFDDSNHSGSGDKINMVLVLNLDYLWERIYTLAGNKKPAIIITQGVDLLGEHGHSDRSYHLKNQGFKAADFIIFTRLDPRIQYGAIECQGFSGIGVYYDWKRYGKPVTIGFHVDLRPQGRLQRWVRRDGKYMFLLGRDN